MLDALLLLQRSTDAGSSGGSSGSSICRVRLVPVCRRLYAFDGTPLAHIIVAGGGRGGTARTSVEAALARWWFRLCLVEARPLARLFGHVEDAAKAVTSKVAAAQKGLSL